MSAALKTRLIPAAMRSPNSPRVRLPVLIPPVHWLLRAVPERVLTSLFATLFTHLLRGQPLVRRLAVLDGKRISLSFSDLRQELRFRFTPTGLANGWDNSEPPDWHVRIRGTFEDFWLLATRAEDPDTLFFNRRLSIEGDTETGLVLKNLLDALEYDWPAHFAAVLGPLAAWLPPFSPGHTRRHRPFR